MGRASGSWRASRVAIGGKAAALPHWELDPSTGKAAMSNGLYQQLTCDCQAVCLMACGAPLGIATNAAGETVTLWPREAVQVGEGVDELVSRADDAGGDVQSCRRCGEVMMVEHEEAGVVALPWTPDDDDPAAPEVADAIRAPLEARGYRF